MPKKIPRVIEKVLSINNIDTPDALVNFLQPRLDQLRRPLEMKNMASAVQICVAAIEQEKEIFIWGDYDVDGTTGTALLVTFLKELGIEPNWYVPNRLTEGYGLHAENFKKLLKSDNEQEFLLITVDCGISNHQEVQQILELGGQVIVTDHHQLPLGDLPECVILNPSQEECGFHEDKLAGVGVAFYLAAAIRASLVEKGYFADGPKPNLKNYLGFVALGTISDLVEITATNRILIKAGMETMGKSAIAGLSALLSGAGLDSVVTAEDIGFILGPRINAAGRLGKADAAVSLLTSDNAIEGTKYSKKLEIYNDERKGICKDNLESILISLERNAITASKAIVVAGDYHVGVIGIVASKLVELFAKPAIVFGLEKQSDGSVLYKGSGRSVNEIDLLQCLHGCAAVIEKYGGHQMAAGLTVTSEKYKDFYIEFCRQVELARMNIQQGASFRQQCIECTVDEVMDKNTLQLFLQLEPFGPGNEKPVFNDPDARIIKCRKIGGNNAHLQLTIQGKYMNYNGIGFGLGNKYDDVRNNPERSVTFTPMLNRYRGAINWQVRVIDI